MEFPGGGTVQHVWISAVRGVKTGETIGIKINSRRSAGYRKQKVIAVGLAQSIKKLVKMPMVYVPGGSKLVDTIDKGFVCLFTVM